MLPMMSAERAGLRSNDRSRNTSAAMAQENITQEEIDDMAEQEPFED